MGCVSSKIFTRSGSFQEQLNKSLHMRSNRFDELNSNGGDQLLALFYTANTVSKKLKEGSANQETTNLKSLHSSEMSADHHQKIEEDDKFIAISSTEKSRSFRTVEDFDALIATNRSNQNAESLTVFQLESSCIEPEENSMDIDDVNFTANFEKSERSDHENVVNEKGAKRKAIARELGSLEVQSFDFSKSGSLTEWLRHGGQISSPGSYITPRFGKIISSPPNNNTNSNDSNVENGDSNKVIFDPELIEQFEQAMEQLTMEEELIIEQVFTNSEQGNNDVQVEDVA